MKHLLLTSAAAAAITVSGICLAIAAPAAPVETPPDLVRFAGCVKPGVEMGCLIVESGGKTYDVTTAKSRLKIGDFASGTGKPGIMSVCMQGEALGNIVLDPKPPAHAPCVVDNHPTAN